MAKRGADTYITKDGLPDSAGWGAGQGTGPTKATAAQMAGRRLAQPRGLRPGQGRALARPKPAPVGGSVQPQIQQQSFPPPAFGQTNGTQQQQGFSFGQQQPNGGQASQSFPPFGNNTNNGMSTNSTFAPPSTGFNFSASGQGQPFNNPFATAFASNPTQDTTNTNGQIFNSVGAPAQQQQQPPNIFGQQQQQDANIFGQSSTPQQQTSTTSIFGQSAGQQQATPNLFGQNKQQSQSVFSNSSSNSFSQPPQLPTVNLFGAQFGGVSQPSQPDTSIFSSTNGTKDGRATTGLFGNFSTPSDQSQHDQTQAMETDSEPVTAGAPTGGNVFGQASDPSNEGNNTQQQSGLFAHLDNNKSTTNIFAPPSQQEEAAPNIFDQAAKTPSTGPQPQPFPNLFNQAPTSSPAIAPSSSIFASPQKPSQTQPDEMSTTPEHSPQKPISQNIFGSITQTKDPSKPLGNSLFDRISKPSTDSDSKEPSTSASANAGFGQPNAFAKASNPFATISQSDPTPAAQSGTDESAQKNKTFDTPNPFQIANEQPHANIPRASPEKTAQANPFSNLGSGQGSQKQQQASTTQASPTKTAPAGGLFGTITNTTHQAPETPFKAASSAQDAGINIFANPSAAPTSTANKFSSALFPSTIDKSASTTLNPSTTSTNTLNQATPLTNGIFNSQQTLGSQGVSRTSHDTTMVRTTDSQTDLSPLGRRYGEPPEPPSDFTELEKTQLITGWRLKSLDVAMQAHRHRTMSTQDRKLLIRFYEERKQQILAANGGPMISGKRKHLDEDVPSDHGSKRARSGQEDHRFSGPSQSGNSSEDAASSQVTFKPASSLANGLTTSPNKRKAEDNAGQDHEQAETSLGKRARGIDSGGQVSYPSMSSFTGDSQTSSLFQSVMGKAKSQTSEVNGNSDIAQYGSHQTGNLHNSSQAAELKSTKPSSTSNLFSFGPPKNTSDNSSRENAANETRSQPAQQQKSGFASVFKAPLTSSGNATAVTSSKSLFTPTASTQPSDSSSDPTVPVFGKGTSGPVNFMGQFGVGGGDAGKRAVEQAKNAKMERVKDDEWDEDEETEKQWEQRYWKELKEKEEKALGAAAKLKPILVGGKWVFPSAEETNEEQTPVFDSANVPPHSTPNATTHVDLGKGRDPVENNDSKADTTTGGLWGRVTKPDGTMIGGTLANDIEQDRMKKAGPSQSLQQGFNTIGRTPGSTTFSAFKPSQTSLFGDQADINKRKAVDEVDRDEQSNSGKRLRGTDNETTSDNSGTADQSSPAKANVTNPSPSKTSLFGSTQNPFGALGGFTPQSSPNKFGTSPGSGQQGDHTWKPETPIKFGDSKSSGPPNVNITSPSPTKSSTPFGSLFGNAKTEKPAVSLFQPKAGGTAVPTSSAGFSFGVSPLKPTAGLAPPTGGLSPLNGGSRSNSPGLTTGESANEATGDEAEGQEGQDEQVNLTSVGAGPDEEVIFEVKSKAHRWNKQAKGQPGWEVNGVGPFRILKNAKTGSSRVLMRQDPSGRVLINQPIIRDAKYKASSKTTFTMLVFIDAATIESYSVKVGKDSDAQKIVDTLNAAIKEPGSVGADA